MEEKFNSVVVLKALKSDIKKPAAYLSRDRVSCTQDNLQISLSTVFTFCQRSNLNENCKQRVLCIILSIKDSVSAVEVLSPLNCCGWRWRYRQILAHNTETARPDNLRQNKVFLFICVNSTFKLYAEWMMSFSLCFASRDLLPLPMVCSLRSRSGITVMVTTDASTLRGAMD